MPCNHNKPGTNPKSERHAHLIYSDDQGATWHLGAVTDHPYGNESTVVELGDGSLMTNMRNYEPNSLGYRWQAVSRDGGLTYEPAQVTTLIEPNNNGCQGSILRYSINSAGKANLLFSNPDHGSSRRNGSIKLSSNDGRSWSRTFKYVPDNDFYSAYSDLAVLANKKVGVLFLSTDTTTAKASISAASNSQRSPRRSKSPILVLHIKPIKRKIRLKNQKIANICIIY